MNEFDNLFNKYFGDNRENPIEKMMKLVQQLNLGGGFGGVNPEETDLGKPDSIVEFEQDGIKLIKSTWNTQYGQIVRIVTKEDVEFSNNFFKQNNIPTGEKIELSLEEQLKIAEKVENYELCSELRDKIKARDEAKIANESKDKKELAKKDEKNKTSENLNNEGFTSEDGWNF
jgi:hypothetical protein